MNKKILFFSILSIAFFLFSSCDDKEEIQPSSITNIRAEKLEGGVMLRWDVPSDSNYYYVEVSFEDPWRNKKRIRKSSIYTDSLAIWGLLERFGDYKFTLQPYSSTFTAGKAETIIATSGYREASYLSTQINLKEQNLSTNAQESIEGAIANLLDDKADTYFHTSWSVSMPGPHYLELNLDEPVSTEAFKFKFRNRKNANNKPTEIDILVSEDGNIWKKIKTLTEADGLPKDSGSEYTSPIINLEEMLGGDYFEPKYFRFNVTKTNNNTVFFTMADFWFYKVQIFDPENDLEAIPDDYEY